MGRMRSKTVGARIAKLVEEAIVDCYTEDEQHGSFLVMLEEHIRCRVDRGLPRVAARRPRRRSFERVALTR
ncbi:MAG: hypothetical protein AAB284_05815 [Chloroflexota bacterium]